MRAISKTKKIILIVVATVLLLAIIGGLTMHFVLQNYMIRDTSFNSETNLLADAQYLCDGKTSDESNLKGNGAQEMTISLKNPAKINTLAFYEATENVTDFEIYVGGNLIYKQQEMGDFRYATFPAVTTDSLTVKVTTADGRYNVSKIEGFYIERPQGDFRVASYLVPYQIFETTAAIDATTGERVLTAGALRPDFDWDSFSNVTDVILFNLVSFDENGDLYVNEDLLARTINSLRENLAGRNIRYFMNALIKKNNVDADSTLYNQAMEANGQKLRDNLVNLMLEKGFDGIDLDYEYPKTLHQWNVFSNFLVNLKAQLPQGTYLSSATSIYGWICRFSEAAWQAMDFINVMAYDGNDSVGSHSGFQQCAVDTFFKYNLKSAVDRRKINLGLPFYSRPVKTGAFGIKKLVEHWTIYRKEIAAAEANGTPLTYWDNSSSYPLLAEAYDNNPEKAPDGALRFFNGPQMIKDKTALAYDYGAGGLMIWNHGSDLPYSHELSLFRAIDDVLQ